MPKSCRSGGRPMPRRPPTADTELRMRARSVEAVRCASVILRQGRCRELPRAAQAVWVGRGPPGLVGSSRGQRASLAIGCGMLGRGTHDCMLCTWCVTLSRMEHMRCVVRSMSSGRSGSLLYVRSTSSSSGRAPKSRRNPALHPSNCRSSAHPGFPLLGAFTPGCVGPRARAAARPFVARSFYRWTRCACALDCSTFDVM